MPQNNVIVIDFSNANQRDLEVIKSCNLFDRLQKLNLSIIGLTREDLLIDGFASTYTSLNTLLKDLSFSNRKTTQIDWIVEVQASQIYLDVNVVESLLKQLTTLPEKYHYATQWEHCRLPIGSGIRAYEFETLMNARVSSFDEMRKAIYHSPERYRLFHDSNIYVNYEQSQLDSTQKTFNDDELALAIQNQSWDYQSFVRDFGNNPNRIYKAKNNLGLRYDDRGLSAGYGFESKESSNFPTYVMLDLTNQCNASCIHCPHSVGFQGQNSSTFTPLKSIKKLFDECIGKPLDVIRITADGEPMLHPSFWEILEYAQQKEIGPIALTTNGSALNQKNRERLLKYQISFIDVSLDAFSEETFGIVRAGLSYDRVVGNLLELIKEASSTNSTMKIMVSFVKQNENAHELDSFIKFWENKLDEVLVRDVTSNVNKVEVNSTASDAEVERWPCPHWFRRTILNYTGDIKACPIDWENHSTILPLEETTAQEVWHNDIYHRYRLEHLNNLHSDDSLCKNCNDWKWTPWELGYEKVAQRLLETTENKK